MKLARLLVSLPRTFPPSYCLLYFCKYCLYWSPYPRTCNLVARYAAYLGGNPRAATFVGRAWGILPQALAPQTRCTLHPQPRDQNIKCDKLGPSSFRNELGNTGKITCRRVKTPGLALLFPLVPELGERRLRLGRQGVVVPVPAMLATVVRRWFAERWQVRQGRRKQPYRWRPRYLGRPRRGRWETRRATSWMPLEFRIIKKRAKRSL